MKILTKFTGLVLGIILPVAAHAQLAIDIGLITAPHSGGGNVVPDSPVYVAWTFTNVPGADGAIEAFSLTDDMEADQQALPGVGVDNTCDADVAIAANQVVITGGRLATGASCRIVYAVSSGVGGVFDVDDDDATVTYLGQASQPVAGNLASYTVSSPPALIQLTASNATPRVGEVVRVTASVDFSSPPGAQFYNTSPLYYVPPAGFRVADVPSPVTDCPVSVSREGNRLRTQMPSISQADLACDIAFDLVAETPGSYVLHDNSSEFGLFVQRILTPFNHGHVSEVVTVIPDNSSLKLALNIAPTPALADGLVDFTYTLGNGDRMRSVDSLAFTHGLDSDLSGLSAQSIKANTCGGVVTLGATLELAGGTLAAGADCAITVSVDTPAQVGIFPLLTSQATGMAGPDAVDSLAATAKLQLDGALVKSFAAEIVAAGVPVEQRFTIINASDSPATDINFRDQADNVLINLTPAEDTCSPASVTGLPQSDQFGGKAYIQVVGIDLAANSQCYITFEYTPLADRGGVRRLETSVLSASYMSGGAFRELGSTSDSVSVIHAPLIRVEPVENPIFIDTPGTLQIEVGGNSQTIDLDPPSDYNNVSFSLTPSEAMAVNYGALPAEPCGIGSSLSVNAGVLELQGGTVTAGGDCAFDVPVTSVGSASGVIALNADLTALHVESGLSPSRQASTDWQVDVVTASMHTYPLPVAGDPALDQPSSIDDGEAGLLIRLENPGDTPLDVVLLELAPTGGVSIELPVPDATCPGMSAAWNTTRLSLSGGTIPAGGVCEYEAKLLFPATVEEYPLVTSRLFLAGGTQGPLSAALRVVDFSVPRDLTPINLSEPDPDGDGLPTEEEEPLGDVNGDGLPDALQGNVASIISPVTGRPVSLEFSEDCGLANFTMAPLPPEALEDGTQVPEGMAEFELLCEESVVSLHMPGVVIPDGMQPGVVKYGPMAPDFGGASQLYDFPATLSPDRETLTFTLRDGELGDSTGDDGRIVDPIGVIWRMISNAPGPGEIIDDVTEEIMNRVPEPIPALPAGLLLLTISGLLLVARRRMR